MKINNQWRCYLICLALMVGVGLMVTGFGTWGFLLHAVVVIPLLWGTLRPDSALFGPVLTHSGGDDLWFTLDDGPDPNDTPRILKLLNDHNVKATFFVIGEKAERYPDLIHQILADGHEIGNHSWSHQQGRFWCYGPRQTKREIQRCQTCLVSITGVAPTLFRAPVGHSNIFVHEVLNELGMELVAWSSRGFDAVASDPQPVLQRIDATMQQGGVILAHESTPIAYEVVAGVLKLAEKKGLSFSLPRRGARS